MGAERHHFKKVTRSNPCPICGKPDWCGWMQIDEGELLVCQRDTEWTDQIGMDGEFYIFVSRPEGKSSSIYEEAHQRARRMNVKASNPTVAAKAKKATRREYTVINPVEIRENTYLDMIYRYMLSLLYLDDDHQEYLACEKWSHELMVKHMIRSFPEADFVRFKYKNMRTQPHYKRRVLLKRVPDSRRFVAGVLLLYQAYRYQGLYLYGLISEILLHTDLYVRGFAR